MKGLRRFLTRVFNSINRLTEHRHEARLREEIEQHIALQTSENLRAGIPPIEARRHALLKFGGIESVKVALGRAIKLLAFGSAVGLVLGILASRLLAAIVYQATPRDPLVLTGVVLCMALLGLLASWIPAQRALSIDPAILLREE